MDEMLFFGGDERTGHLLRDIKPEDAVQRTLPFHLGKNRLSVDELHRVKIAVSVLTQVENRSHVSMPQPSRNAGLAEEPFGRVFAVQKACGDHLQRNVTIQIRIKCLVRYSHGAAP